VKRLLLILLLFFVVSCKSNAESQLNKIISGKDKIQKNAILEVFTKPKQHKNEIMSYLTKKRDFNNEKEWPSDNVLYVVGAIRDRDYFPIILSYLDNERYCNSQIPEYVTGLEFALTLLIRKSELSMLEKKPDSVIKENILSRYNDFYEANPKTIGQRKKELANSVQYRNVNDRTEFIRIQNLKLEELLTILYDSKTAYDGKKDMAIDSFRYLVDNKKYIPDLLYLAINSPNDGANEFLWSCISSIYNIFIQNGENK